MALYRCCNCSSGTAPSAAAVALLPPGLLCAFLPVLLPSSLALAYTGDVICFHGEVNQELSVDSTQMQWSNSVRMKVYFRSVRVSQYVLEHTLHTHVFRFIVYL